jgi:6-pyruvoyltetrahydropterin/6-carboxytetrahydropterin synthase
MFEVWKEFKFDCAHTLDGGVGGDQRYTRIHGHSYQAEVWVRGEKTVHGWVTDLGTLDRRLAAVASQLDHRFLNEVESLGPPTMENLSAFIWASLEDIGGLYKVTVRRDSSGEGCSYFGPSLQRPPVTETISGLSTKEIVHA